MPDDPLPSWPILAIVSIGAGAAGPAGTTRRYEQNLIDRITGGPGQIAPKIPRHLTTKVTQSHILLREHPRSEARLLRTISDSAASVQHEGVLSPTSVYGQVPDYAMPSLLARRRADVVILDQVQVSAGITAQDEPPRAPACPRCPGDDGAFLSADRAVAH